MPACLFSENYDASRVARGPEIIGRNSLLSAIGLLILLAALDVIWPNVSFSVLFCIPLVLVIWRKTRFDVLWVFLAICVLSVVTLYFIKYTVLLPGVVDSFVNFRFFNRLLVVGMLTALAILLQSWMTWQRNLSLLDQDERTEENAINGLLGLLGATIVGLVILVIDGFTPRGYNLSIFYILPLYFSSWSNRCGILWATCGILMVLTVFGHFVPSTSVDSRLDHFILLNRCVVLFALFVLTAVLAVRISRR